ncbi:hypothetical protein ACRAVF_19080 [Bradyrhizobium oligotrophicum S58]
MLLAELFACPIHNRVLLLGGDASGMKRMRRVTNGCLGVTAILNGKRPTRAGEF